jgi:GDP-L-fucose synthase
MKEEFLLSGPLEPTNQPYAVAKIAGVEMCWSYNRQYGTKFLAAMPTNLFGPDDNYDLLSSHAMAALIRKAHEAKVCQDAQLRVWGSGNPRREFLYSDDMADACLFVLSLPEDRFDRIVAPGNLPLINIGAGKEISIRELAETISQVVGFRGALVFDDTKPDGTPRKLMDGSKMERLGWRARVSLRDGIAVAYKEYLDTYAAGQAVNFEVHEARPA